MSSLLSGPDGLQASNSLALSYKKPEQQKLSLTKQKKQDALDLATLIYDIFKESESSANIGANAINRKGK